MEKIITNSKLKYCLLCNAPTNPDDSDELFCSSCGSPLINHCSNYQCQKPLAVTAAYCKHCGSSSIFLNAGLVESKHPSRKNISIEDFPF